MPLKRKTKTGKKNIYIWNVRGRIAIKNTKTTIREITNNSNVRKRDKSQQLREQRHQEKQKNKQRGTREKKGGGGSRYDEEQQKEQELLPEE